MRKIILALVICTGFILISCGDSGTGPGEKTTYNVSANVVPTSAGVISPSVDSSYKEGRQIELLAEAADAYIFTHWSGDIDSTTNNPLSLTSDQNFSLYANFKKKSYNLKTNKEGKGAIIEEKLKQKSKEYDHGTVVELTATAAKGWTFAEWKGAVSGSENPKQLTIKSPKKVKAVFRKPKYKLTINITGKGKVKKQIITAKRTDYEPGTIIELKAKPNKDWEFIKWDNDLDTDKNPVQIAMDEPKDIQITFGKKVGPRMSLTQSTQSLKNHISMVKGRDAALFLYLYGKERDLLSDKIHVNVLNTGSLVKTISIPSGYNRVNDISSEVSIMQVPISGKHIRPGLSVNVETASGARYPIDGSNYSADVQQSPDFQLRFVPIHFENTTKTGNISSNNVDSFLEKTLDFFPINNFKTDIHPPVTINTDGKSRNDIYSDALQRMKTTWIAEGKPDFYYYGVIPQNNFGLVGLGYLGYPQAVGWDNLPNASGTVAHELGHNFSLQHTNCGNPDRPDPNYPYNNANIGVYGYELDKNELKYPDYKSFMSYCDSDPTWISDYEYEKVFNKRLSASSRQKVNQTSQEVLLVRGIIDNDKIFLKPPFRMTAPSELPDRSGAYTLTGYDNNNSKLFSLSFTGKRVSDDHNNTRTFTFAIPINRVKPNRLQALKLTGKSRSVKRVIQKTAKKHRKSTGLPTVQARRQDSKTVKLNWNNNTPDMTMIKDANTGEVLSISQNNIKYLQTTANELMFNFSNGIRTRTKRIIVK